MDDDNDRYIIIGLIGNTTDDKINANIIDGYYQSIFPNIIRDFAMNIYDMDEENVKMLVIGKKQNYSVYDYRIQFDYKYYFKLDAENTFQIDIDRKNTNFQYFAEFDLAINQICEIISNNQNKNVILFIDNHGDNCYFEQIHYYHLYEITMKFNSTSFLIFNDSCYSGSFINFAESYNEMISLITSKNLLGIKAQLLFAFKNLFEYAIEKVGFNDSKKKVLELIDFYQSIKINEEQALNLIKNNSFLDEVDIDTTQLIFGEYKLIEMGFKNNAQINDFKMMIDFYGNDVTTDEKDAFKYYKNIFNKNNFNIFINLSNEKIQEFIKKLNVFYVIKDNINFDLLPNKHVEIITSTDNLHKSISFPSIRINNSIKISPGCPAMGSFIKALFIKNDPKSINFEEIKKEISQSDDGTIYYPLQTSESIKNDKKERQWIHLYPKHYKLSEKDNDEKYSFTYSNELLKKIAVIRAISFLNVQKLTETAAIINSKVNSTELQPFADTYGSIFAISALLNEYKNDPNEMIVNCFKENPVIRSHKPNRINSYCLILKLSFKISNKNPKLMTGVIINILEKAVKKVIKKKIDLIIEKGNSENFTNKIFLDREISDLLKNQGKILTEFKDNEFPFLKQIENVILSFICISQVAFAGIIASSLLFKKIDLNTINEMTLNYFKVESNYIFNNEDQIYNHFLANINKCQNEDIIRYAEYYLLEMIDASFLYAYSICYAQFKCDSMKIVSYSLENFTATSIVNVFNYYLDNKKNESFIKHIIDPIERIIKQYNIPNFYILTILSLMPKETVIYALYMSLSNIENDWLNNLLSIIEIVKDDSSFEDVYSELLSLTKKTLSDQINVQNSIQYKENTVNMEKIISNEIEKAIVKLYKIQEKSLIKARENISKQMDINIIEDQIKSFIDNILCNDIIKSKFDMYLKESKNEILKIKRHQINLLIDYDKIPTEECIFDESILDIKNICERASKELITVAHLFKISDESKNEMNSILSKRIKADISIELTATAMVARAFNIVEMAPIANFLSRFFIYQFDKSEGKEPSLKELMAILSANIYILPPKDEKRQYLKIVPLNDNEKIEDNKKMDFDSYDYNDDDDLDDELLLDTLNGKSLNKTITHRKIINSENNEILKYYEYRIDFCEVKRARDILKLGKSSWPNDAWKTFLYCFNLRMKNLEIQFNLSDDYGTSFCPFKIDEGINIVLKFYPITRIHEIFQNKEKFNCFIAKYSNKHKEIIQAFIRSFDDVDLIVTSLYLRKRTYFDRTLEKLKIIYDYPYSKTSKM